MSAGSDGTTAGGGATGGGTTNGDGTGGPGNGRVVTASGRDEQLIIKTATLTLEVGGIHAALRTATEAIDALGGHTNGSERSGSGQDAEATATFRVPAARFDEAMNVVRDFAREVLAERSTTEEVTAQVVDLGARIRNLQVTERALQSIMDQATVIKDVLSVQAELTTVRGSIEQLNMRDGSRDRMRRAACWAATFPGLACHTARPPREPCVRVYRRGGAGRRARRATRGAARCYRGHKGSGDGRRSRS